jgi:glutamate synthase (NADPH/NADH) small chain
MGFIGSDESVYAALGGRRGEAEGVFTCGDMRTGQSLVVKAITDGMECAKKIDEYLK